MVSASILGKSVNHAVGSSLVFVDPVFDKLEHFSLNLALRIVEIGMEETLQYRLRNVVHVVSWIIPCMDYQLHGVNDDDLGEISSRFV